MEISNENQEVSQSMTQSGPASILRRVAMPAIFVLIACLVVVPHRAFSLGISITGVNEGSVIVLPANVAMTNLAVTAIPSSPTGTTNIAFALERQGSVIMSRTSAPPYSVTFTNLPTGKYFLSAALVAAGSSLYGDVSFDIAAASLQPANDDWTQAAPIAGVNVTVVSSNFYATSEPDEPVHGGTGIGKSVWWKWTASSTGTFTATTAGSGFDSVLGIYTGTNLAALAEVAANDDAGPNAFSQATFQATNGTVYYFAVDSASVSASGEARLKLVAGSPPAISITSPPDGALFLVGSPTVATNTQVAASVSDPSGVSQVDYWFDGGAGMSLSGVLSSPYQLNLTNLLEGHYVLTLVAHGNSGLVGVTNSGLSVISLAPVLVLEGASFGSGKFQLAVTGFKGPTYALQASTNLEVWCSVRNWTNFAGAEKVADTNAAQFNRQFYRASSSQ